MKFLITLPAFVFILGMENHHIQEDNCILFNGNDKPRDTLRLNVTYIGLVRLPGSIASLGYLEKKHLLKTKDFKSSLLFKVDNCPFEYNLVYSNEHQKGKSVEIPENTRVQITCVIFRDDKIPLYASEPFPVITNIKVIY